MLCCVRSNVFPEYFLPHAPLRAANPVNEDDDPPIPDPSPLPSEQGPDPEPTLGSAGSKPPRPPCRREVSNCRANVTLCLTTLQERSAGSCSPRLFRCRRHRPLRPRLRTCRCWYVCWYLKVRNDPSTSFLSHLAKQFGACLGHIGSRGMKRSVSS